MKESAIFERNLIRDCDVEGAINGTYEILCGKRSAGVEHFNHGSAYPVRAHFSRNETASSGGRSTTMNPFAPACLASLIARSSP